MNVALFVGGSLFGMGMVFILIAVLLRAMFQYRQSQATAVTTATVVELIRRRSHNSLNTTYAPVYEYYANGELLRVESTLSSSPCPLRPGDQVELHFVPDNPKKIFVEKEQRVFRIISVVFIGVGSVLSVVGLILWVVLQ